MTRAPRSLVLFLLLMVASPSGVFASPGDLAAFLSRAERMATLSGPVKAKIAISRSDGSESQAVLVIDPSEGGRQFLHVKPSGWKSLAPLAWGKASVVKNGSGKPVKMDVDTVVPGTDLRLMEFFAFWAKDYTMTFISDESRLEKTVSLYAADEQPYSLYVISFDKAKLVPLTIKYYRENFTNLVRLRTNSDYKMVGSRPLPGKVVIQDYSENSTTTLNLVWETLSEVPEGLTDVDSFHAVSAD